MLELTFLLLPFAAYSGWRIGRRSQDVSEKKQGADYYAELDFLLNEKNSVAIDKFVKILEVSPDTVETMLSLGNFFRRRGEVARAILIHQSLISKPHLTLKQQSQCSLELAQDYMCAGVYDRAESLLLKVTQASDKELEVSLRHLKDIYEREKDWEKAIEVAQRLQMVSGQTCNKEIAHYHCELAESAWACGKIRLAFKYLRQSLRYDKKCVRASVLQGNFEKQLGRYKLALQAYQAIEHQDITFMSAVLDKVIDCYQQFEWQEALGEYLSSLMHKCPTMSVVLAYVQYLEATQNKEQAARFLSHYMYEYPSIRGLKQLVEFHLAKAFGQVRSELSMLNSLIAQLLEKKPVYRCKNCGFSSLSLHWQCPSCRQWSLVCPIQGIEGE